MDGVMTESGYQDLMADIRLNWDAFDQFACVQEWRFAICEVLFFDHGVSVNDFYPGGATEPEHTYAVWSVRAALADTADVADVQRVLAVLDRYRGWLALAGKDY